MALTAVTLLGENTVPILADLCRWLGDATGIPVVAAPVADGDAAERATAADLIWACGYLTCALIDGGQLDAEIVAAPVFAGEAGPTYHSVIVAADPAIASIDDAAGGRVAINETISWSGHLALVEHLASCGTDLTMFGDVVTTGSHAASVTAVATGAADVAAIDHTVWAHLRVNGEVGASVRAFERTQDWPSPPFAIADRVEAATRADIIATLTSASADAVAGLDAICPATRVDYDPISPRP